MVVFSPGRPFAVGMSAAAGRRRGKTQAAELPVDLEWGGPEMRPAADIDAAAGIYGGERADRVAVAGHRGGRAESALEVDGGGAEARPGGTQGKDLAGARGGGVAEIPVGREAPPVLVAAIEQVEQRGPANERHSDISDRKAAAALAQEGLHARTGVKAEGRAAGQHHGVDALDGAMRLKQVRLARGRRAAAHVDSGHGRLLEHNGRDPRGEPRIIGLSDQNAGDVGDQISSWQGSPRRVCMVRPPRTGSHANVVRLAIDALSPGMKMDERKRSRNFTS